MLKLLMGWIVKTKTAKTGASILGGSTLLAAIIWPIFTYQSAKVDAQIIMVNKQVREYVDLKHENVMVEVKYLRQGQSEIKELLKITNKRLYQLKRSN